MTSKVYRVRRPDHHYEREQIQRLVGRERGVCRRHLAQPNANHGYAPLFNIPVPQTASRVRSSMRAWFSSGALEYRRGRQ